jgi:YVTN family beta-propeller protein
MRREVASGKENSMKSNALIQWLISDPRKLSRFSLAAYLVLTFPVIASADTSVVTVIPVGTGPVRVAISPSGARLYVVNRDSDSISVISTNTNLVVNTISVGDEPHYVAFTPDGSQAWVTNRQSGTVMVIDTTSETVLDTISVGGLPDAVTITNNGSLVYVTNDTGPVAIISVGLRQVVGSISIPDGTPELMSVTRDDKIGYLSISPVSGTGVVRVVDLQTNQVSGDLFQGSVASLTNNDRRAWGSDGTGILAFIELRNGHILKTVAIPRRFLAVSPDEDFVYVADIFDTFTVIHAPSARILQVLAMPGRPTGDPAISSDCSRAYVANLDAGTVTVVDLGRECRGR